MRTRSPSLSSCHVFKVLRADGRIVEVEKWAESAAVALPLVRAFVAIHWPGARLMSDEHGYQALLAPRAP